MEEIRTGAVATTESVFGGNSSAEQADMPEPATVFGFAPEEPEAAAPEQAEQQNDPMDANTGEETAAAGPAYRNDRKRDAFAAQRRDLEAKYKNDPARLIGERILKDRMRREGVDRDTAYRLATEKLDEFEAKTANVEPSMYRFMREVNEKLGIGEDAREAKEPAAEYAPEPTAEERAQSIVDDLMSVPVPRGFDMDAAVNDPAFVDLLAEYPAAAAVRIYQAEHMAPQQVADRLRARQGVPASTRPTQSVRPTPNYKEMSSDDFFKMKERVSKTIY